MAGWRSLNRVFTASRLCWWRTHVQAGLHRLGIALGAGLDAGSLFRDDPLDLIGQGCCQLIERPGLVTTELLLALDDPEFERGIGELPGGLGHTRAEIFSRRPDGGRALVGGG